MRITEIFCEVQWSQAVNNGNGWKKVALARKAVLDSGDNYQECHQRLYDELAEELKAKFSHRDPEGNGSKAPGKTQTQVARESRQKVTERVGGEPPSKAKTPKNRPGKPNGNPEEPVTCPIHNVEMPQHTNRKNGVKFHSHRLPDGSWCRGKLNKGKKK